MSEPMGCSDHLAYCPDSGMPILETVSEENRRQTGNLRRIHVEPMPFIYESI